MAPESINFRRFTTASDVWMFGEIMCCLSSLVFLFLPVLCDSSRLWQKFCFDLFSRRLYVGDPNVWYQAFSGREKQWRHWQDRERRASSYAPPVPSYSLQLDDKVLVIRSQQEAAIHWIENTTEVLDGVCHVCLTELNWASVWQCEIKMKVAHICWLFICMMFNSWKW